MIEKLFFCHSFSEKKETTDNHKIIPTTKDNHRIIQTTKFSIMPPHEDFDFSFSKVLRIKWLLNAGIQMLQHQLAWSNAIRMGITFNALIIPSLAINSTAVIHIAWYVKNQIGDLFLKRMINVNVKTPKCFVFFPGPAALLIPTLFPLAMFFHRREKLRKRWALNKSFELLRKLPLLLYKVNYTRG